MTIRVPFVFLTWSLFLLVQASAQTDYSWNGTTGAFSDAGQWTPAGGPPTNIDRALFQTGSSFTVSGNGGPFQTVVDVSGVTFTGALSPTGSPTDAALIVGLTTPGQATFSGSGASLTAGGVVAIGPFNNSTLTFSGGATGSAQTLIATSGGTLIGLNPTGNGTLTVTGTDSMFTSTGTLALGGAGTGVVNVQDNASLETNGISAFNQSGLDIGVVANSNGTLNISGNATVLNNAQTNLGLNGRGIINISSGMFTTTDGGLAIPAISIARFGGSQGDLNVSGTGIVTTEGEIIVGGDGLGRMMVTDNGLVQSNVTVAMPAIVGFGAGSQGTATIDGIDAQWNVTDALIVGQQGFGTVQLNNGGTLFVEDTATGGNPSIIIGEADGSSGSINVGDEFSFLDASFIPVTLGVAENSNGSLSITDQAKGFIQRTIVGQEGFGEIRVETDSELLTGTVLVGEKTTGEGFVEVFDGSSLKVLGQLIVGDEGIGEVSLEDSSLEVLEFIVLGNQAGSTGTMFVSELGGTPTTVGGTLTSLTVGNLGAGELDISGGPGGASISVNGPSNLAVGSASTATVFVGPGSVFTTTGALTVGDQGAANFNVSGTIQSGTTFIAKTSGTSSANFSFGTWTVNNAGPDNGSIFVGGSDTAVGGTGQLFVSNGTLTVNNRVKVWNGSSLELSSGGVIGASGIEVLGEIAGTGTINAPNTDVSGTIAPRKGGTPNIGRLSFNGNLTMLPGSLYQVELGGTTPQTEFDVIDITGDAALDGILNVFVLAGFSLSPGQMFEIMDIAGTQSGMFAGLADGALVGNFGGTDLFVEYHGDDGNDVVLFTNFYEADFDEDLDVDSTDLAKWETGFGLPSGAVHMDGDADVDFDVDGADFLVWQQQFGAGGSIPIVLQAATIPEPTAMLLAFVAVAAMSCIVGRTHRRAC